MMEIQYGPKHGYCVLVLGASWLVNVYQTHQVSKVRMEYDVKLPTLFSTDSGMDKYNCIQWAHQNYLESWGSVCLLLVVNGAIEPVITSAFGGIWCIGRLVYAISCTSKGVDSTFFGRAITQMGQVPLVLLTFYNGYKLVKS